MLRSLEELESKALRLLLKEPESERPDLLRYAASELDRAGLNARLSSDSPNQAVHDLIGSNMAIPDWLRARELSLENLLQAEDFKDLIDRLTPAYGDG